MVLPVNMQTGFDTMPMIARMGYEEAQTRLTDTENDQKRAEYDEYISDTQKNLRKQKAIADTYTAQVDQIKNKVILDDPDQYRQLVESGLAAQLQQNMAAKGQAYNERLTNIFGPGVDGKDDAAKIEDYKAKMSNALKIDPSLIEGMPTVAEVTQNPGLIPRINMMVGTAWENNSKYLQAAGEARIKSQAQLMQEMYKQGQMNAREGMKQDRADNREIIKGGVRGRLLGAEYGLKGELEGIRQSNRIGLEGERQKGRVEIQGMKDKNALERARIRAKSDKKAQPQLSSVGLAAPKNYMESMVLPTMKGFGLSQDDMDEDSRANMATELFAKTQQIYLSQFYNHQDNPDAPPPQAPGEITKGLIQSAIEEGQIVNTATFGKNWEFLKEGSDSHVVNWIDLQDLKAAQKVQLNKIYNKLKEKNGDPFKKLSWEDKKDLIMSQFTKETGTILNKPQSSTTPQGSYGGYAYGDEEDQEDTEDDEEES